MTNDGKPELGRCPICGRPAVETVKPFCSKRCADVDLQRWLSDAYAIPVADDAERPDDGSGEDGERP